MTLTIVGSQLGDEGKGALVDRWGGDADVVVRYQGGDNAGHTVVESGVEYKLSLVPSGAVRGTTGILGNGCVVNPRTLFTEIDDLRERGLDPDVRVARRAHVILPYHRALDGIEEEVKSDDDAGDEVGTTGRGIGPTYEDKAGRRGIRIGDLLDPDVLRDKLEYAVPQKRALVEDVYGLDLRDDDRAEAFDVDALHEEYAAIGERLADEGMTVNCSDYLHRRHEAGDEILFEGAQGTHIDVDHGNYPFVTSSNPTAGAAAVGSGLGVTTVGDGEVVGIVKAYLSRVGEGPLPTELDGDAEEEALADHIREKGGEFGTVTGRPRRIGWLDLPMLRHAARVSGFTGVAVNHVDVLAGLDELKVCTAYELDGEAQRASGSRTQSGDGETIDTVPTTTDRWERCEPVYETLDTWEPFDSAAVAETGYDALPEAAREYLEFVAEEIDAPVYAVGVGPDREETVELTNPFDE